MEYTKNYHLPQWVKSDRIMMDDFNDAMASMESGMTATADTANAAHNIAQKTAGAAFTPDNMPYVVGAYTGNGETYRDIQLGFQPSFLIICRDQRTHTYQYVGSGMAMAGPSINYQRLYLTSSGFRIDSSDTVNYFPELNKNETLYNYIAFR